MRSLHETGANVAITTKAAAKLSDLREQYHKHLKFHLFLDDNKQLTLRIHDRIYSDDWIIEINGVGVSFSTTLIAYFRNLVVDCVERSQSGIKEHNDFEFRLIMNETVVSTLGGDEAIKRIASEEVEVCDAYGEFCYSTYS